MNSFSQILAHWSAHRAEPCALATITHTQGSTYRKAGARMLVDFRGRTVGMISGGCLEEEIAQRARQVMREEKPAMVSYDTRRLFGCNGALDVLIEPLWHEEADGLLPAAEACFQRRTALVGTTLFEMNDGALGRPGSYGLFAEDGARLCARPFPQSFAQDAMETLQAGGPVERSYPLDSGCMKVLLQRIAPCLRLVICGGGPDVIPLASLAAEMGWETTVVVHPSQAPPDVAPACRRLIITPEELRDFITADARTCMVIMSHNYGRDLAFLTAAFSMPFRYVGLLGPSQRREKLLGDLGGQGVPLSDESLENFCSPAGLDLGADGPEEVALSIVSEILAVTHRRNGAPLRHHAGPIHANHPTPSPL